MNMTNTILLFLCIIMGIMSIILVIFQMKQKKSLRIHQELLTLKEQTCVDLMIQNKSLNTELQLKNQALEKQTQDFQDMKKMMLNEFSLISSQQLEFQRTKWRQESEESFQFLTKPLKEQLFEFKQKIENYDKDQTHLSKGLKEEIQKQQEATELLVNTFKTNKKTQGIWGEQQLEMLLEQSGLRTNIDYQTQFRAIDSDLQNKIPDVVVRLPENKAIVIDAKVSFVNYARLQNEMDLILQQQYKKDFMDDIKKQVQNLSAKDYTSIRSELSELSIPEFVLMFIPFESAFILALQTDPSLYQWASEKKVILCSPTTLFAMLQTVASLWNQATRNQKADEIFHVAKELIQKVERSLNSLENLEKSIKTTHNRLDDVKKSLTGRQGIIPMTNKLDKLGVSNSIHKKVGEIISHEESLETTIFESPVLEHEPLGEAL